MDFQASIVKTAYLIDSQAIPEPGALLINFIVPLAGIGCLMV